MSLSRGYNTATYTNGPAITENIAAYERGVEDAQGKVCAGPGHPAVDPRKRKSYYKAQDFFVAQFEIFQRVKVDSALVTKVAYLCDGMEVDVLVEPTEGGQTTVTVCLYAAYVGLFFPYRRKYEVVLEFANGECSVVDKDSVLNLTATTLAHVTVRMVPQVCRVVRTLDELSATQEFCGNYRMFAMSLAKDGAQKTSYSVLFFCLTSGFICTTCGKTMKTMAEAVEHVGDKGMAKSYGKVVHGLSTRYNPDGTIKSETKTSTICTARSSDYTILKNYFSEYSIPVDKRELYSALQRLAPKRQKHMVTPWNKR